MYGDEPDFTLMGMMDEAQKESKKPFHAMLNQTICEKKTDDVREYSTKNFPQSQKETLWPHTTVDGRHLVNGSIDLVHMTKRVQVLNQTNGILT